MICLQQVNRSNVLMHSAKGTTWDDHKYIKKVNGVYYYPSDYKGGRHAGDTKSGSISKEEQYEKDDKEMEGVEEAWESTVYSDIDRIMKENPNLTDPVALAQMAFDNNLKGKMPDEEIARMMEKVKEHYSKKKNTEENGDKNSKSNKNDKGIETIKKAANPIKKMAEAAASVKKKKELKHSIDYCHGIILERRNT